MTNLHPALPHGHRVILKALGETPVEAIEQHLELVSMEAPDPAKLAPEDVVVAVKSASVNWVDLIMTSGQYQHLLQPPYTPGLESAGHIVAKGSKVEGLQIGDAVLVDGLMVGPRSLGAYQQQGGFASYVVAPGHAVYRVPTPLSLDQACNLLGNYETAYHCLVARGNLSEKETVLILGASGSTGLAAVEIAKLRGATVIAVGRTEEKLALAKAHGADHLVVTQDVKALREAVKSIVGQDGVDVVYDGVGGDISVEALRCLRFGGRYLVVGWASTPFVAKGKGQRGAPNVNVLPTNLILMKGIDVLGCPTAIATAKNPAIRAPRLRAVLDWAEAGKIRPHVAKTYPLASFKEAMLAKWNGELHGNCALHP